MPWLCWICSRVMGLSGESGSIMFTTSFPFDSAASSAATLLKWSGASDRASGRVCSVKYAVSSSGASSSAKTASCLWNPDTTFLIALVRSYSRFLSLIETSFPLWSTSIRSEKLRTTNWSPYRTRMSK